MNALADKVHKALECHTVMCTHGYMIKPCLCSSGTPVQLALNITATRRTGVVMWPCYACISLCGIP